jgi:uncharacterized membrane protein YeaQ/YmgE (transglycosylase-associated protein family)
MQNLPTMAQIQPYWPYIVMLLNGLVAGWLAGQILGGGGIIRNAVVGVLGAVLGGVLVQHKLLTLPAVITNVTNSIPYSEQILVSTIGAMVIILVARFLGRS